MKKSEWRKIMLDKRDALENKERSAKNEQLQQRLLEWKGYIQADCLCTFASYGSEIDTHRVITDALERKKRVVVPRVNFSNRTMVPHLIDRIEQLEPGFKGILEPADGTPVVPLIEIDLCLVPGVVFDPLGQRIGYGGGFYDRFLPLLRPDTLTVGIAFDFQLCDALETEEHDVQLSHLITDQRLLKF